MSGEIRVARTDDAAPIQAIYAPIVRETHISFEIEPPAAEEISRRIAYTLEHYPWLVYCDGGTTLGYAYAGLHRTRAAYRWSVDVSVYVHPDAQRRGIARALYTVLFAILRRQHFQNVYAGIALPNAASVALHRELGMHTVGIYRNVGFKRGVWWDVLWLEAFLQTPSVDPPEPEPFASCIEQPWLVQLIGRSRTMVK